MDRTMTTQRDWHRGSAEGSTPVASPPSLVPDQLLAQRPAHGLLDPSLKTIFDDLVEGVLVIDIAGHRIYSNPALNDLIGGNACQPLATPDPPAYIPLDQRQRYFLALKGTSSLLTMEGSGAASTWLELTTAGRARVRTRVTISSFTGPRGWRFAVWLINPELAQPATFKGVGGSSAYTGASAALDGHFGWAPLPAIDTLTRREKDVLQLLLDGRRVSSIARTLYLSPQTVRNHLKAIFRKLGAHSQAELLDNLRAAQEAAAPGAMRDAARSSAPTSPVSRSTVPGFM
jgi:DNA-binding CsgD family transcriptional regulator